MAINDTDKGFSISVREGIYDLERSGERQLQEFWEKRVIKGIIAIDEKISKNSIILPGNLKTDDQKNKVTCSTAILNKLQAAIQYRPKYAETLFSTEINGVAQAMAETDTKLYRGKKSQMLKRFSKWKYSEPCKRNTKAAMVVEMSTVIQINANVPVSTFDDFSKLLYIYILNLSKGYKRVDIVCDRYLEDSIKEDLREDRGSGSRKIFNDSTKFPKSFRTDFLANSQNKESLNHYLAEKFMNIGVMMILNLSLLKANQFLATKKYYS